MRVMEARPTGLVLIAIQLLVLHGCGGGGSTGPGPEPNPQTVATATVGALRDQDNKGDGRDLQAVILRPGNPAGIQEMRAIVVSSASGLNLAGAVAAPVTSYVIVPAGNGTVTVGFQATTSDASGQPIVPGGSYVVYVLSVAVNGSTSSLSAPSVSVTLTVTDLVRTLTSMISAGTGGLDVDAAGNIYLADFGASLGGTPGTRVLRITPAGEASTFATGLLGASGNVFDSQGVLVQSSIAGGRVDRISPDGTVSPFATGLRQPVGIAVVPGDTLFVVNCGDRSIDRITPDGTRSAFVSDPLLNCPNGITHASDGNFYVANFNDGQVLRVTRAGAVTIHATLPGGNNGHILFGNGVLYVAARGGNRIYQVGLNGTTRVLAGTGVRGLDDGAALDATLSLTNDIALSPDGRILYFNDVGQTTQSTQVISPTALRMIILDASR